MKPKKFGTIKPTPYFCIAFECSNRKFYGVKNELFDIAEKYGIELQDGHMGEKCDYEGDLEEIIIYRDDILKDFTAEVLNYYGVTDEIPENMNIHFSIFYR